MQSRELVLEGSGRSTFVKIDATKPETLEGVCENVDCVITTVGLTKASATVSCYDIDLNGNKNILAEAKRAGVKKFVYISVIHADEHAEIPMLDAKAKMEEEVKKSGIPYIIYRPTGYFYDIVHVLKPMVEKGEISLLGKEPGVANVIATEDFAEYIVDHLGDENVTVSIGALNTLAGPLQWLLSILGYVSIVYVMISGAARLEKKQNKRYGDKKEYQEYVKRTPILLPIIPVYHLSKQEAKSDEVK